MDDYMPDSSSNLGNTESTENIENTESIENTGNVESIENAGNIKHDENSMNGGSAPKPPVYYTESYKKPKGKKFSFFQLILVAVLCSVFGGGVVFAGIQFLAPIIQPAVGGYFGNTAQNTSTADSAAAGNNGVYKKVEITQSSSPITAIAEKVGPAIVGIRVTQSAQGQNFFFNVGQGPAEGSGIIIREDGYILTNNHVIEGALAGNSNKLDTGAKIEVILPTAKDKPYTATVVGKDAVSDIAVLKIEAKGLPTAELGDSDKVKTGELAVAIGNPGGMDYMGSVTAGIISGLNRNIQTEDGQNLTLIQTDAAINPGNSGGALCNSQGQVIGVNTIKIAATGFEGLGFAIPINHVKGIAQSLIDYKYVKGRPYLGVSIDQRFTEDVAKQYNVPMGLLVADVTPLSAAYKAGIHTGDIITKFDGKTVKAFKDLEDQKNTHKPGDQVTIEVYRDNATKTLKATLDEDKNQ